MMKNMWKLITLVMGLFLSFQCVSCSDKSDDDLKTPIVNNREEQTEEEKEEEPQITYYTDPKIYAGFFAYNMMSDVYLWKDEITLGLSKWKLNEDPIKKVKSLRYTENGTEVDKWTMLTNDYESFIGSVDGVVTTTYGFDFQLYYKDETHTTLVAVVLFTYPGSPAEKAGLKRGDAIFTVNGKDITVNNYADLLFYSSKGEFALLNDTNDGFDYITMTAVNMYENPVLMSKVFDCGGKKVGYLAYISFTIDSCEDLIAVAKDFKEQGVTELILDFRYNGGGYVVTENLLASLLAPQDAVQNNEVYQTEIWNKEYMDYYKKHNEDLNTYFQTKYNFQHNGKKYTFDISGDNIGINKIYALVSASSASASEAILVGLKPYMDIQIIGEQTHGKYCTGWMISATDWFDSYKDLFKKGADYDEYEKWETYAKNWGIYIMICRYADKNGNCPCMPNGFTPDIEVMDKPEEPYNLGDDREALLRVALTQAGYTDFTPVDSVPASRMAVQKFGASLEHTSRNPLDGKRIMIGNVKNQRPLIPLK